MNSSVFTPRRLISPEQILGSRWWWGPGLAVAALIGTASLFADPYLAYVASSWIIFGLLGLSLDLVWGRSGILSLGQTAFYGIGGYLGGIAAINLSDLAGGTVFWSLPVGALAGAIVSALVGGLIFYGRIGALQATVLTYALTLVLWTAAVSFKITIGGAVVGGDNGLSDIPGFVSFTGEVMDPQGTFIIVLTVATAALMLVQALLKTPFGTILSCIRMNATKAELLGYDIRFYQLTVFSLSGAIAGLAGALYGSWSNYLSPSIFSPQEALLVPIYVLVGGRGTLIGPFVGAVVVGGLSFWLGGGVIGGQTTLILGLCLIALVLFLKRGILGAVMDAITHSRGRNRLIGTGGSVEDQASLPKIDFAQLRGLVRRRGANQASLRSEGAVKSFGGVTPVKNISQRFSLGQVHCLIGPNGAGKSSFLRCCTGVYRLNSGSIYYGNEDITRWPMFKRARAGIGIKTQAAQVFDELDVYTNLWIAAYCHHGNAAEAHIHTEQMLCMLGLAAKAGKPASELSHGEQQWLDIGMVLCTAPSVLLLDEPAAGMTGEETRQLSLLIRTLVREIVIVVVEHDMEFIRTLDAEVTVLHQGAVFAQGSIDDLRKDERILDIYLGRREHVRDL